MGSDDELQSFLRTVSTLLTLVGRVRLRELVRRKKCVAHISRKRPIISTFLHLNFREPFPQLGVRCVADLHALI